jgi:hypothetical protein
MSGRRLYGHHVRPQVGKYPGTECGRDALADLEHAPSMQRADRGSTSSHQLAAIPWNAPAADSASVITRSWPVSTSHHHGLGHLDSTAGRKIMWDNAAQL